MSRPVDEDAGNNGSGNSHDGDDGVVPVRLVQRAVAGVEAVGEVEWEEAIVKRVSQADDTDEYSVNSICQERRRFGTYPQIRIVKVVLTASFRVEKRGITCDLSEECIRRRNPASSRRIRRNVQRKMLCRVTEDLKYRRPGILEVRA